jgi:predicted branched-subunit amino acid permease
MVAPGDALAGARRMAPLLLSIVPFSFLVGATAIDAGLSPIQTIAMSLVVFAGAAQIAAVDLLGRDAPVTVVALTAIVIKSDSSCTAPRSRRTSMTSPRE